MHMFTRSLMCMQNTEEIQLKLWEELITQNSHFFKKYFFSIKLFMHIFNMSVTRMQNIKEIQCKL